MSNDRNAPRSRAANAPRPGDLGAEQEWKVQESMQTTEPQAEAGPALTVGYIGLGAMGGPLAQWVCRRQKLVVLDRNPDAVRALTDQGATAAPDGATLARQCDVIVTCLPRSADVEQVLFGAGGVAEGLSPGKIVIDQTSGNPTDTRRLAARLSELGVAMLDAPVTGGVGAAIGGTVLVIVSGDAAAFRTCAPVFGAMTGNIVHCSGPVGTAQAMKLINNAMSTGCRTGTFEALSLGRRLGLAPDTISEVLHAGIGWNRTVQASLPAMLRGEAANNFRMALMLKDLDLALQLGRHGMAPMPVTELVTGLLQTTLSAFGEDAQLDQLADVITAMAGVRMTDEQPKHAE